MIQYEKVTGEFNLAGKAAIVVGGAGGIGEATARMYAKKGAKVAIVDCKDTCPEVAEAIKADFGTETIGVKCDVTSQESVDAMMKAVVEAFGEVNILAAMPGFVDLYRATDIEISNVEKHIAINAVGVFRVCQAVANQMIKQGKVKTDMIEKIPAHRFAETDEIAAAVLFLSCAESNMITGEDLVVDGGFTIY